ncbi:MAG: hypothetical protein VB106_12520 [Clostridiaceae bacterium]|nr:hypothetical protein [Clostridiaceae bacterium]
MKKRKMLAVLMAAVIMIASMPGLAVQADTIGKEAQACKDLEILIGADASGVTSQYLSTTPTRIQAFIIVLRLKGLYGEASKYEGEENFKDADTAGWAKSYMAYAKSHPDLGWGGYPDGTFAPTAKINGQAFYKVMLETLGYRQDVDFTYAETLEFAEDIDLVKDAGDIEKISSFTVNDIAVGIYDALNTKPADSDKKLISVMVENNIIASDKAVAAGFTLDAKNAGVVSFNAVSNNKIEVEFDEEILLQKADVEISELDGKSRLSVLSVDSDGRKAVITTTEAKSFNAYEVEINTLAPTNGMAIRGYKNKYVAMPKDTVKPTVKHELLGRNEILLTFSEAMDRSSAENLSNYMIENDVTVLSADLSDSGKSVTLETTEISSRDFYRLTVQNVYDLAGNKIDRYRAPFDGADGDSKGPSIINVRSENNRTVTVTFNERLNAASAEDIDNYDIDGISIMEAELDESGKIVTLTTEPQDSSTSHKLIISDIEDTWGNAMYRKELAFVADSSKPYAVVVGISSNEVQITFTKKMDRESAEDADNYSIDDDLDVEEAILDDTEKIVTLITSEQTLKKLYTLRISGVYDAWGNSVNTTSGKFGGMAADTRGLSYTAKSSGNGIVLTFNKRLDKETAEDVFNYVLDKSLGYAAKAELDSSGKVVTLLTANHSSGKIYTIRVENVKAVSGEKISSDDRIAAKKFAGMGSSEGGSSSGTLSLETVVTVNVNTIDLVFNDELTADELDDLDVKVDVPDDYDYDLPSKLDYYKYFVDNNKNVRLQFKTDSDKNPEVFEAGNIYEVEVMNIDRLNSKDDANVKLFAGTSNPNEEPEVLEVNALNSTAVEVVFSEPVKGITASRFEIEKGINISGISVGDSDVITDKVLIYISSKTKLDDYEYKLYVKSGIKDAAGINSLNTKNMSSGKYIEFDGNSDENESPFVESDITVIDSYTIQFELSEEIGAISNSSFSVKRASGSGSASINISKAVLADNRKTVTLYLNSKYTGLSSDYSYELGINSSVKDLQGMSVDSDDRKVEFDGDDIEMEELEIISAYIDEDNRVITLIANRELDISSLNISDFGFSGAGYYKNSSDKVEYNKKSIIITLKNELDEDEELTIEVTSTGRGRIRDLNGQALSTTKVEIDTN